MPFLAGDVQSYPFSRMHVIRCLFVLLSVVLGLAASAAPAPESNIVYLAEPGRYLYEALPLGNGRLGASLYGGVEEERIVLNESGMWSGSPQDADRDDAAAALPEIRRLLLEGKNAEAEKLVNAHFTCAGKGSGSGSGANVPYGCYQTLGDLRLTFLGAEGPVSDYRRLLDLSEAVARLTYEQGGVRYSREAFVSKPAEAFVLRLSASESGRISFDAALSRKERATVEAVAPDRLVMYGQLNDGYETDKGVRYATQVQVVAQGGSVSVADNRLQVRDADEVLLFVSAATAIRSFAGRTVTDPRATAAADLAAVTRLSFEALRDAHRRDYQGFYDRVSLRLGAPDTEAAARTTPERLRRFHGGAADPSLATLYFNFGRYLLISSSRPGGFPANLQGIWAEGIQTPWNCDWHSNVNVQMNYWPAEVCNLSELSRPLFDLIASLPEPGAKTAQAYYNARGWVSFLLQNPWGFTSPGESASWGSTVSCSAWLCQHLWDHYLFTGDREFLAWAYPILKGSALFYLDMLIEEPKSGWLVTAPSNSPENAFYAPDGSVAHVCLGPTADNQLLRYLFTATAEAAGILGQDAEFARELRAKRDRLPPTRIGSDGRIMEWLKEYREVDPHHRHIAHLWGLYPGHEITPRHTPALAEAARKTLNVRGDPSTGWSLAYKLTLWARLGDGERAHKILREHLKPANAETAKQQHSGGTYANLFDAHPPFQIDGNFGGAAGIAELLLQSSPDEIILLPGLPSAWPEGAVRGLRARGGFEVDARWEGGRLVDATIRSVGGKKTTVRYGEHATVLELAPGKSRTVGF